MVIEKRSFKARTLPAIGAPLRLEELPVPGLHPSGVLVWGEGFMVLSHMAKVLDGSIAYATPPMPFVPGTNAIGLVEAMGADVSHGSPCDRVLRAQAPPMLRPRSCSG